MATKDEINEITEALKTCNDPLELATYLTKLAGWVSYYSEMMKKIQLAKPQIWLKIKKNGESVKPLSDTMTDMSWEATEEGQKEIALKWELKRIEQMVSAIKQRLYAEKVDYKNLTNEI